MNVERFGVENDFQIVLNTNKISDVFFKSNDSYLISSSNGISVTKGKVITDNYPYSFSVMSEIKEYNLIVGYCQESDELFIFSKTDPKTPLLEHFNTQQTNVTDIVHANNSRFFVVIGKPIKAYQLNVSHSSISISFIGKINEEMLNNCCYAMDSYNDLFYYLKDNTIYETTFSKKPSECFKLDKIEMDGVAINIDDHLKQFDEKFQMFSFCSSSQQFAFYKKGSLIITDADGKKLGSIELKEFQFSIMKFLNSFFLLMVDNNNDIFLYDVKLFKHVSVFHFNKKIDKVFFISKNNIKSRKNNFFQLLNDHNDDEDKFYKKQKYIIISSDNTVFFKKISLPYKSWVRLQSNPTSIKRCNKKKTAARIMIFTKDNKVLFYSPKTSDLVCSLDAPDCNSVLYDRGIFLDYLPDGRIKFIDTNLLEDRLFTSSYNRGITVYDTDTEQCLSVAKCDFPATAITLCEYNDRWVYCIATPNCELVFLSMVGYCEIDRVALESNQKRIVDLLYHHKSHCIYAVLNNEINRFDFKARRIVESIAVESNVVSKIHGDLLMVGFRNGIIQPFIIHEFQTFPINNFSINPNSTYHKDAVTGLTFSSKFFVSSSLDGSLKYWDYSFNLLYEITLPFPLLTCELLNGKRHVLVGIEKAILYVDGSIPFGEESDIYEATIDSFDLLYDKICPRKDNNLLIKKKENKSNENIEIVKIFIQNNDDTYLTQSKKTVIDVKEKEEPKAVKQPKCSPKKNARKKKKRSASVFKSIKTPRRKEQKEPQSTKEVPKKVQQSPPTIPSYRNQKKQSHYSISSLSRPKVQETPKKNMREHHYQNTAKRPSFQTHIYDFSSEVVFGNDASISKSIIRGGIRKVDSRASIHNSSHVPNVKYFGDYQTQNHNNYNFNNDTLPSNIYHSQRRYPTNAVRIRRIQRY